MKKIPLFTVTLTVLALGLVLSDAFASDTADLVLQTRRAAGPLAFNPAGTLLATGRAVWDVQSGKMLRYFSGRMAGDAFGAAFDKTGQWFAAAGQPHCIEVWNASSGEEKYFFDDFKASVTAIAFAPDRNSLAGVDESGALAMYDIDTGKQLWKIAAHAFDATSLAISPDGAVIATAGYAEKAPPEDASNNWQDRDKARRAREIKLWDAATGRALSTYALEPRLNSMKVFFSSDGKFLIAQTPYPLDSQILAIKNGKLSPASWDGLQSIEAISDDGYLVAHYVAVPGSLDGEVKIWDRRKKQDIQTLPGASHLLFAPHGQSAALGFGGFGGGVVYLFNLASGQEERRFSGQVQRLDQCVAGASGTILATVHEDGWDGGRIVQLWNGRNGQQTFRLDARKSIQALALSDDEKLVFAAAKNDDPKTTPGGNKIFVWDTDGGKLRTSFVAETEALGDDHAQTLAVSPDGNMLAIGTWSLGKDFSPNEAGGKDDTYQISLWDWASHKLLKVLSGHKARLTAMVFSSDGKVLFSASDDETIRAWDVASGTENWQVLAHDPRPSKNDAPCEIRLALSPDGNMLAAGLNRGTIKIFDAASGRETASLAGHDGEVSEQIGYDGGVLDLCFAPDGKTLYSSGWDARWCVWEIPSGKLEREQAADYWKTLQIVPGNRLITANYDGLIEWRNAVDGKLIATLAPSENGGGVVVTPRGYYQANREALGVVGYRVGAHAYGFEQFDLYFNQPAQVLRAFGDADPVLLAAYDAAYEKRLRKMGVPLSKGAQAAPPADVPEVSLDTKLLSATTDKARITIPFQARVTGGASSLKRLLVWVNGVPSRFRINGAPIESAGLELPEATREYSGAIEVELSSFGGGRNKIEVAVQSGDGVESRHEVFEVTYKAPLHFPDLYIAVVGVSEYADASYNLTYAAKDAGDMAKLWESQAEKWNEVHVRRLLDDDATHANILQLREFLAASHPDDEVIVFFSGHGLLDDKDNYYFATHDIDFSHPEKNGLSYDAIENLVDSIPARRKLVMMDTCHSGEVDDDDLQAIGTIAAKDGNVTGKGTQVHRTRPDGGKPASLMLPELFADLRRGSGAQVIAASGGLQFSFESPQWNNGVFTYSVLEGLKTRAADEDKNGKITVSELRDYVAGKVLNLTHGRQRPVARQENLESDFEVF